MKRTRTSECQVSKYLNALFRLSTIFCNILDGLTKRKKGSRVFSGAAGPVSKIVDWVMNNLNLTFSLLQQASSEASMDKLNYWIICRYKIMIKLSTQCTPLLFTRWWGWSSSLSSCFSSFLIRTVRRSPVSSCLWSGQSQPTGDVEVLIQIKLY